MKKVASFCFLSLMLSLCANSTFAQDSAPRRMQAGMTGNFGINMVLLQNTMITEKNVRVGILESSGLVKPEEMNGNRVRTQHRRPRISLSFI